MRGYLTQTAMRARARRSNEQAVVARLQLTSLIDIFTVLLLFLLQNLVVGGAAVSPFPGVTLPPSTSDATFKESPVVVVTPERVIVDGVEVCSTEEVRASESLELPTLASAMGEVRQKSESLASRSGSAVKFEGRMILQADEAVPFHVLQKVMYNSQTAGFYDITLAVVKK
jgi:biopolymer transport protein ExbD